MRIQPTAFVAEGAKLAGLAARLGTLLANRGRHRAVREAVGRPIFAAIRARQPQLARKYLNPFHLAIGLTSDERAALMIHHYDFIATKVPAATFSAIVDGGKRLWCHDSDAGHHRVDVVFSHPTDNEGELTLKYTLDDAILSICSFSFAPGSLAGSPAETIIAVTRIQGMPADLNRLRAAIRSLGNLSPAIVFIAVLAGIANCYGIPALAGIAGSAQPARDTGDEQAFANVYDAFFESIGGVRATPAFYRIALPRPEKPLSEVKRTKRARTVGQRELRACIRRSACMAFSS
ncbi:DUF535 family protein [Glacieibacterium megasporae]|uniref:DUF535 family protein n=1 Tax=Glacieibacterium megasporae TaxID=2835787 RepID=UPI001C1E0459|nr:DUF535 family protein [Polymorphobacter megasporae]